jgi:hypothetical protein
LGVVSKKQYLSLIKEEIRLLREWKY